MSVADTAPKSEGRKIGLDTPANGKEVAKAFGGGETMMTASRAFGYKFKYGTKTTLRHYMAWREAHPDFRTTAYVLAHSKKKLKRVAARGHSQRRGGPRGASARTRG